MVLARHVLARCLGHPRSATRQKYAARARCLSGGCLSASAARKAEEQAELQAAAPAGQEASSEAPVAASGVPSALSPPRVKEAAALYTAAYGAGRPLGSAAAVMHGRAASSHNLEVPKPGAKAANGGAAEGKGSRRGGGVGSFLGGVVKAPFRLAGAVIMAPLKVAGAAIAHPKLMLSAVASGAAVLAGTEAGAELRGAVAERVAAARGAGGGGDRSSRGKGSSRAQQQGWGGAGKKQQQPMRLNKRA